MHPGVGAKARSLGGEPLEPAQESALDSLDQHSLGFGKRLGRRDLDQIEAEGAGVALELLAKLVFLVGDQSIRPFQRGRSLELRLLIVQIGGGLVGEGAVKSSVVTADSE